MYFQLQAVTTNLYSIAMGEPNNTLISYGIATVIFLPLVLVSTLVYEGGFLAICICTSIHLLLRFLVAITCVHLKSAFSEANKMTFFRRETFQNYGYQLKLGLATLLFKVPGWWMSDLMYFFAIGISEEAQGA